MKTILIVTKLFGICLSLTISIQADAAEIFTGVSAVDQGDDIFRPGILIEGHLGKNLIFGSYYVKRTFGPVTESLTSLYGGLEKDLFKALPITARIGLSFLKESTQIDHSDLSDAEDNFSLGALLGASYKIDFSGFILHAAWDSHLYPVGLNGSFPEGASAMILMATGRKHTLSLQIGVAL